MLNGGRNEETYPEISHVVPGASASSDPPPFYTWSQTMEDVSVTFTLPPGTNKVF